MRIIILLLLTTKGFSQLLGGLPVFNTITTSTIECPTSVTDYDGNTYSVIQYESQCWMGENLNTTHYNDGTLIPNVTNSTTWGELTTGARCYYNNDSVQYASIYGALYNYFVDVTKICPTGWHVPDGDEWIIILGSAYVSNNNLKGYDYWAPPNSGAVNRYGFNALPGGYWSSNFKDLTFAATFMTLSSISGVPNDIANGVGFIYDYSGVVVVYGSDNDGVSIRCIKD